MEKKINSRSSLASSRSQPTDLRKSNDNQRQRTAKRREINNSSNHRNIEHLQKQTPSKNRNHSFDKGSRPRRSENHDGGPSRGTTSAIHTQHDSSANLAEESEDEDAVASSGLDDSHFDVVDYMPLIQKKKSWNYLLQFYYAPPNETRRPQKGKKYERKNVSRAPKFDKEMFIQANCQLVVRDDKDYSPYLACPDQLVQWDSIEQVIRYQGADESAECPICLYPLVAAKMNRCGHVFCWPCILHYVEMDDAKKRCPICLVDCIYKNDLKSTVTKSYVNYNTGNYVKLELLNREEGSMYVVKGSVSKSVDVGCVTPLSLADDEDITKHAKILVANKNDMIAILARERKEIEIQLASEELDTSEVSYLLMAQDSLVKRETLVHGMPEKNSFQDIKNSSKIDTTNNASGLNPIKKHYFYQSIDGQHLYLHSINLRMIEAMFKTQDNYPAEIECQIIEKESRTMTEEYRKGHKNLQHLPLTCQFDLVEVDLSSIVSADIMKEFNDELKQRKNRRERRAREERRREKRINEENDRQMGKIPYRDPNININSQIQFPCVENNAFSLENTIWEELDMGAGTSRMITQPAGPTFAAVTNNADKTNAVLWPSLGAGGNEFDTTKQVNTVWCNTALPTIDGDDEIETVRESINNCTIGNNQKVNLKKPNGNVPNKRKKSKRNHEVLFTNGRTYSGN